MTIKAGLAPKATKTWFQSKLEDKEISQRQAAEVLGLDPSAVSNMLSGKRRMKLEEASAWARLLGEPLELVLKMAGIDVPTVGTDAVPIVGWADEAGEVHLEMKSLRGTPLEIARPPGVGASAVAVRLLGPGPTKGWTAFYVPARVSERVDPSAVGRWSAVQIEGGGTYLRVLERDPFDPDGWALQAMSQAMGGRGKGASRGVRVEWAAPVVWVRC